MTAQKTAPHVPPPPAPQPPGAATPASPVPVPADSAALERLLAPTYLADAKVALSAWLALKLARPLLLEGPAGVGKTDLARALAESLGRPLVRLQCYEGLDEAKALYEWDYAKQMLFTQLLRAAAETMTAGATDLAEAVERVAGAGEAFFSPRFLVERPILRALRSDVPAVLLIDEIDRADPEFEAFLLEVLAENQVTLPEIGVVRATHPPLVLLTTNGSRDMSDALRRRCLHAFLDYPPPSREQAILELRVPGLGATLAAELATFAGKVRALELRKTPSIAETIEWARALLLLGANVLEPKLGKAALGALVKYEEDREKVEALLARQPPPGAP